MRPATKKMLATGFAAATILSLAGCGAVDQVVCDDVELLEQELVRVEGQLEPEVAEEVRDDYAEMATDANCPGYDA